jgi:hypothetical protein
VTVGDLALLSAAPLTPNVGRTGLREGLDVLTQPVGELASVDAAGRQIQYDALLLINDSRQREVAHQARRRYNSAFFLGTRSAAALNSGMPLTAFAGG